MNHKVENGQASVSNDRNLANLGNPQHTEWHVLSAILHTGVQNAQSDEVTLGQVNENSSIAWQQRKDRHHDRA
jgi:hypothetical protein